MEHTKGPWKVIPEYVSPVVGVSAAIEDTKEHRIIAELFGTDEFAEEAEANAAFIVKAVNSHDELLEALKGMLLAYEGDAGDTDSPACSIARAAIARSASTQTTRTQKRRGRPTNGSSSTYRSRADRYRLRVPHLAARRPVMRECNCPEWVIRCAHWEGDVLALSDPTMKRQRPPHVRAPSYEGYAVRLGSEFVACSCHNFLKRPARKAFASEYFATIKEAEAEFYKREALLLGH